MRVKIESCTLLVLLLLVALGRVMAATLGPAEKVAALREQLDQVYSFVVRYEANPAPLFKELGIDADGARALPIINALAVKLKVADAFTLAQRDEVKQVWYLHPELSELYINSIAALDYNVENLPLPSLVNLSIGPQPKFWTEQPHLEAPMQQATRIAAEKGLIPVVAIGNSNQKDGSTDGWINPWSYPEWVVAVGAWNAWSNRVAEFSSRGDAERPETWPDVIAHGVDVIGPYPTNKQKSAGRKHRDESSEHFRNNVAKDKWDIYTLESGSSQSAALVSGAASQILHFLNQLIRERRPAAGQLLFALTAEPERITEYDRRKPRLTGNVNTLDDGSIEYEYYLDEPWKMVKQLLVDTAIPVPGAGPQEAGAGIVDREYIDRQFGQYGLVETKISASKVL